MTDTTTSEYGDISAWLQTPPPQPRWSRLDRFDSVWGATDGVPHWRGSEWRLELSRRSKVHKAFVGRRIAGYTRNRAPLTERALWYHGKRFKIKMTWQAKS